MWYMMDGHACECPECQASKARGEPCLDYSAARPDFDVAKGLVSASVSCLDCRGTGKLALFTSSGPCPACEGRGLVTKTIPKIECMSRAACSAASAPGEHVRPPTPPPQYKLDDLKAAGWMVGREAAEQAAAFQYWMRSASIWPGPWVTRPETAAAPAPDRRTCQAQMSAMFDQLTRAFRHEAYKMITHSQRPVFVGAQKSPGHEPGETPATSG